MLQQTPNKRVLFRYRLAPVLLVLFGVFSMLAVALQSPQKVQAAGSNTVNFQARLQTASGAIVPDDTYNVQFKLYSGSSCAPATGSGCTQEWTESYQNDAGNGVQVINGYLTVNLGSVTAFPTTLDWDQPLYLSMNIGGTTTGTPTYDGEMKPFLKLTAVPYAFQAKSAGQLQQLQGSYAGMLDFTTLTDNRTISLPDANGTVCLQNSADCGFLSETTADGQYLQNSATMQTGNINLQAATSGSVAATFQANASGTGDILDLLNGGGVNVLSVSNAGDIIIKPSDTSLTGFQIQNSSKTIFDVDTTNGRVGISMTNPSYALDVNGDINSTTAVRVGGVAVCTVSNCVPTSGSNNYVQNTTGTQDGANINIRSVATNAVTAVLQGASGQTADILQVEGWDGTSTTTLASINNAGLLTVRGGVQGVSGGDLNIQADGTNTLSLDTGGAGTVNLGTHADTINIGTGIGAAASQSILIGGDAAGTVVGVGATGTTGLVQLQTIDTTFALSGGQGSYLQSTTNSAAAFQIQNSNSAALFSADTTAMGITISGTLDVTGGYQYNGTAGATTTCSGGTFLQNQVVQGGIVTGGTCAAASAGITSVGTYSPTNTNAKGATISGSQIVFQSASINAPGMVDTQAQTFAGDKTFNGTVTFNGMVEATGQLLVDSALFTPTVVVDTIDSNVTNTINIGQAIGGTATSINLNQSTTVASGKNLTITSGNLNVSGAPTASATSSLIRIGNAIQGGNNSTNGGTYIGLNAPASGAGSAADLINLQQNNISYFNISPSNGTSLSGVGITLSGTNGINLMTTGTITAKSTSPNTIAFQVQNASNIAFFSVNTSGTVTLGDSTSGNYITVASTGLTAFGTARHTKTILLPAEYSGAALDAANDTSCTSANSGNMASGFDSTSRQNFYSWTANVTGTECYDVVVQVPIPSDFAAWSAAPTLYVANTASSSTAVCVEAITTAGSIDANYGGYACTTTGSSLSLATLPSLNSTYTGGGYMTFKIRLSSTSAANTTKIGNLTLQYYSKF